MRVGLLTACLLLCGCFGLSLACAESTEYPDLVGNWTGVASGYYEKEDLFFNETMGFKYTLTIPEQQGRVLKGTLDASGENYKANFTFSGIIDHDLTTLYMAEKGTGMDVAHIVSPTEMEFIGLGLDDSSTIVIDFTKKE